MALTQSLVLLAAGFLAGAMNSIAGGGTLVSFPTLVFVGLPPIVANATSTVAILPGTAGSLAGYRKNLASVAPWLKLFSPVCLVGGLLGGILLVQTPSDLFDVLVPFLILFATLLFTANTSVNRYLKTRSASPSHLQSRPWVTGALLFQFGVALYGGYFGAGIGILMLASLGVLGFRDVHQMNTIKVVLGFLINVVAAVYFIANGLIVWHAAGIMALGTIGGGYAGAHYAQKVPQSRVRGAITAIGLIITAVMFYRQFGNQ